MNNCDKIFLRVIRVNFQLLRCNLIEIIFTVQYHIVTGTFKVKNYGVK